MIKKFAQDQCQDSAACSMVVIMSHGGKGGKIMGYNDQPIFVHQDVLIPFSNNNAPGLRGKPKLFIFQACRYQTNNAFQKNNQMHCWQCDRGSEQASATDLDFDDARDDLTHLKFSDMIQVFPNAEEYASVRDPSDGSWFVQVKLAFFCFD